MVEGIIKIRSLQPTVMDGYDFWKLNFAPENRNRGSSWLRGLY